MHEGPQLKTRVAYAILEGGGAKGVSHVGALRALQDLNVAIIGIAGSSAGAVVAALAAVGYQADELFEPRSGAHLLAAYQKKPLDLLGLANWRVFQRLRGSRCDRSLLILTAMSVLGAFLGVLPTVAALSAIAVLCWILLVDVAPAAIAVIRHRGLFSTAHIQEFVNQALYDKLKAKEEALPTDGIVRFCHLPPSVPLKIIVSDVFGRQLRLFDAQDTPNASVGDTVAASAAIPFFFKPPNIRGLQNDRNDVYADGGLVSNLPAWAFDRDKRRLERYRPELGTIPIFAFELRPQSPPQEPAARGSTQAWRHLVGTLETGIFASQAIVQRFVSELSVVPVETTLTTLGFDCNLVDATSAYDAGYESVAGKLGTRFREENATIALLEVYRATARDQIARSGLIGSSFELRCYIVDRKDDHDQVVASAGMELNADDRMVFDSECPLAPAARKTKDSVYFKVKEVPAKALAMTKQEYALLWRHLHSLVAIPVFDSDKAWKETHTGLRPEASRVLCLDSDHDLAPVWAAPELREWLQTNSVLLSRKAILSDVEEASRGKTDLHEHQRSA